MLVQSTSQINATSSGGETALHLAAKLAGPEIVTLLLNAGIEKDAVDPQFGRTALMNAAKTNDIDATVNALLSANADITRQDLQGDTALLLAARSCHAETVSTLIFKNAKPVANVDGETPLMAAIKNCPGSDVLASLTALGGINAVDKMDRTPLWYAAMHGNVAGISLLLKLGASVNGADKDGLTPLLVAAARGQPEAVAKLVEAGADTAVASSRGNSASHLAVAKGCVQCLSVLVRKGPDIDRKNDWGETALALATRAGSQEAVTVLIQAGANPDARDKKRDTPRKLAERLKLNAILAAMDEGR
jgi:ankyrin repeat protein